MVGDTAVAAADEVYTEAEEAADFMEAEVLAVEAEAARSAAVIRMAGIVAAATTVAGAVITAAAATMAVAAGMVGAAGATAGVEEVGVEDMVTAGAVGAGDLATVGRIGDMAGAIRMATTATAGGITRPTVIMVTRPTGLRTT